MISRIWDSDPRPETAQALLEDPFSVYGRFNETLDDAQANLRIEWPDGR